MSLAVAQAQTAQASSNAVTASLSTSAGSLLAALVLNSTNTSANVTMSDTASQTWSQTASGYQAVNISSGKIGVFFVPNSAAVTGVTATWGASVTSCRIIVVEITGAALSSPEDTSVNNASSGSVTSLTSGAFTTANANDILIYALGMSGGQSNPTAGSGYTIPANGSGTRQILEYQIVSATQSSQTASASWTVSVPAAGIFVAFKGSGSVLFEDDSFNSSTSFPLILQPEPIISIW